MPRAYVSVGDQTIASPTDTCLTIESATTIRPSILSLAFSCTTDAQDVQIRWTCGRFITADGVGTGVTPTPVKDLDPAALAAFISNHTTEPTTYQSGEEVLDRVLNSRSLHVWYALQGYPIEIAAVAGEGVGVKPIHSSNTSGVLCEMVHVE